jgi:hypothetical protein
LRPIFFIREIRNTFTTEAGLQAVARRFIVPMQFRFRRPPPPYLRVVFDTGAPFSVFPYSFWHGFDLDWDDLGSQFFLQGALQPDALTWFGAPCHFGQTHACLLDEAGQLSPPLLIAGKFVQARVAGPGERNILLGAHVLERPGLDLALFGGNPRTINNVPNVVGQFTVQ